MTKVKEIWKDIPGYEGLYQASSIGRVKRLGVSSYLKSYNLQGYRQTRLYRNGDWDILRVHRLVAFAFIPNPQNKPHINHINGKRDDNRVENLEWVTRKENMQHATRVLRSVGGERNHFAKLTEAQVLAIRAEFDPTDRQSRVSLSKKYKLHYTAIHLIISRKTWKYI